MINSFQMENCLLIQQTSKTSQFHLSNICQENLYFIHQNPEFNSDIYLNNQFLKQTFAHA